MYVVECADRSFYAGITTCLRRRLTEHNTSKKGAKYTRSRRPVKLIYDVQLSSRSEAARAEASFKKLSRKQKERFLREKPV